MTGAATTVGLTKDAGWQVGVRRTFPVTPERAWQVLMDGAGRELWSESAGEVRARSDRHLRVTWNHLLLDRPSRLQLRVEPAASGATVAVHQDMLSSDVERSAMKQHWSGVLERLGELLTPPV